MRKLSPVLLSRLGLVAAALVCTIGMVGPFQGVEEAYVPWDKAAHFLAFYGITAFLYVAFPHRRRLDLTFIAILFGSATEIAQALSGRDAELGDVVADAAGACAVLAPMYFEQIRAAVRAAQAGRVTTERRRRILPEIFARPRATASSWARARQPAGVRPAPAPLRLEGPGGAGG